MIIKPIRIASLNARSIFKDANKQLQKQYVSYLRSHSLQLDVLCLQEVSSFTAQDHLSADQVHRFHSFMFPSMSAIVTKHCAIICLNTSLTLENGSISMDERVITASVMDQSGSLLCHLTTVYAPAQRSERLIFYDSFHSLPMFPPVASDPWILLGDFNMDMSTVTPNTASSLRLWLDWVLLRFNNCFASSAPTFVRGETRSTIDYVFGHPSLGPRIINCNQTYLPSSWTDHVLLSIDLVPSRMDIGPGSWRFNPLLLDDPSFVSLLEATVNELSSSSLFLCLPTCSQWESMKTALKYCAQSYSRSSKAKLQAQIGELQKKRVDSYRNPTSIGSSAQLEKLLDFQILQETQQCLLRSATRWHETGERNNKYFYNVIKQRQSQQTIQSLRSSSGDLLTNMSDIMAEARLFYQDLYTPDDIDQSSVDTLLNNIPPDVCVSDSQSAILVAPITEMELMDLVQYSPLSKSPGLDGLPFEVYKFLVPRFPAFSALLLSVLNNAFHGEFPATWKQTRMVLLFKKGDPLCLKNWRPLSLINTDAKLFTKLITRRFNVVLPKLINPYQTGFLPNRLISDNGWINNTLMSHFRSVASHVPAVAVLLDQEKAYDRIHPEYLRLVLQRFGFPMTLVDSLLSLFFGTKISLSINGWLGSPISQLRGLRQGDPLSPLLFNLAFEPLLRTILASPLLSGVSLSPYSVSIVPSKRPFPLVPSDFGREFRSPPVDFTCPPSFKLLSYADDLEVFLSGPSEWSVLSGLLDVYSLASNAKVNIDKTEIVSLSGVRHQEWLDITSSVGVNWHDSGSVGSVRYLGYPLYSTASQLDDFLSGIKLKISRHANMLSSRGLSVRGASLVANSLLLSKLWHILRVVSVPKKWLDEVRTVVRKFVCPFWPAPSWSTLCQKKKYGGLGLVDLHDQHYALHMVYLQRMMRRPSTLDFVTPFLLYCLKVYTGHVSLLPWFLAPHRFKFLLSALPTMKHLTVLLGKLPPLLMDSSWDGQWFLDIPVACALDSRSLSLLPSLLRIAQPPLRFLVSDLLRWMPFFGVFASTALVHELPPPSSFLESLVPLLDMSGPLRWHPAIRDKIVFDVSGFPLPVPAETLHVNSSWFPDCSHWSFVIPGKRAPTLVSCTSLSDLRQLWHSDHSLALSAPSVPAVGFATSPLCPWQWRLFWALPLVHNSVTPWWRLLHNSVGFKAKLHRWNSTFCSSPLCPMCLEDPEDAYHFVVGCWARSRYWKDVTAHIGLSNLVVTDLDVWSVLMTFSTSAGDVLSHDQLSLIGAAFATLWRYYWACFYDNTTWSSTAALNMFISTYRQLLSSFYIEFNSDVLLINP